MVDPGEAWRDGYVSAWREAAAWCAGRAAATDDPHGRLALWDAYNELTKQAAEADRALAGPDREA